MPFIFDKSGNGAFLSLTDAGLPERMTPFTLASIAGKWLNGCISQYTFNSLTLRAIN